MKKIALLFFGLMMVCAISAQNTFQTLIPWGSSWKYLDNGTSAGANWQLLAYNDATWNTGNGKFGHGIADAATTVSYGPNASQKYITTYFRKVVNITNPAAFTAFTVNLKRDDGVIVYVNGVEYYRAKMPSGTPTHTTLASSTGDKGAVAVTFPVNKIRFVNGANVISAEIHLQSPSSPEMAFDIELTGTGPAQTDVTPPAVQSINRLTPSTANTSASSLTWRAIFSEPVTGVDINDFALATVNGTPAGSIAAIAPSGSSGTTYDVTVNSVTGPGELRLDLKNSATGIIDAASNAISSGFTAGQTYIIESADVSPPTATSINRLTPSTQSTSATSVIWRIAFDEKVNGVDVSDFSLVTSGGATGSVASVAPFGSDGRNFDVTVNSITGTGELRLNLNASGTGITDDASNPINGGFNTGQTYIITSNSDVTAPVVSSINRQNPTTELISVTTVVWRVIFSERVNNVDISDVVLTTTSGNAAGNISAVAPSGTAGTTYDFTVNSITGTGSLRLDLKNSGTGITDVAGNPIAAGFTTGQIYTISSITEHAVVPYGSNWKYLDNGTNQGTTWKEVNFDDAAWKSGNGKFGFGIPDAATTISYGPNAAQKYITTYFRKSFNLVDPNAYTATLTINARRDDGIVIYVNNKEAYRGKMPTGTPTYTTLASGKGDIGATPITFTVKKTNLFAGKNVIAVEIHLQALTSPEMVFDLELRGTGPTPPPTDPAPGAPTLVAPTDAATDVAATTTFSWNPVATATKYRIEISESQAFATTFFAQGDIVSNSIEVQNLLPTKTYYWRVRGSNASGDGTWSAVRSFATATPPVAPVAPVLSSPANNAVDIPVTTTLSWNAAATATKYEIQVSTSQTFATTFFTASDITETSAQVSAMAQQTQYYWRVRAGNTAGYGDWSEVRNFTTVAPPPTGPAAPLLNTPANNAVDVPVTTNLSWNTAAGATKYEIQVSTDQTFATIFFTANDITLTSSQVSGLTQQTQYYWRVRAGNAVGNGDWSEIRNFTTVAAPPAAPAIPTLNAPADNAVDVPLTNTLSWNASATATKYEVEVSASQVFATTFFTNNNVTGTSVQVSGMAQNTVYYWRVKAGNAGGNSDWSAVRSFTTVASTPPAGLSLIHYWNFNAAIGTFQTPTVTLTGGTMTTQLAGTSVIEVGTGQEFASTNGRNGDLAANHFRLNNPIGSVITLNVSTAGFEDVIMKYESRRSGTGAEIQKISYSLDGTTFIHLQSINIPSAGIPPVFSFDFSSIAGADDNANFKIKIEFEQGAGTTGGNDRIDNITIEGKSLGGFTVPGTVQTNAPANNAQEVALRPDFSWDEATDAVNYQLQVATDNAFTNVVAEKTVAAQTHKLEAPLNVATDYYWRVRGSNPGGNGEWSAVKTFKTILQAVVYTLAVNEVVSTNTGIVADEDLSNEDWIEIHNYGTAPINLEGIGLTDLATTPFKWIFPAQTIAPGQFMIIWASNKNRVVPGQPLHTNFAISSGGEDIVLTSPDGVRIDISPAVAIPSGASRARQPDGTGAFKFINPATPGAANTGTGVEGFLALPGFSQPPGIYQNNVTLSITHSDPGATIRYTLDGSEPVGTSPVYSGALQLQDRSGDQNVFSLIRTNNLTSGSRMWNPPNGLVRKGTVIRAKAFKAGSAESPTLTGTFLIVPGRQYTLPVISVVAHPDSLFGFDKGLYVPGFNFFTGDDGSGNYYQRGDDWERAGSVEFFSTDLKFQQNIGYRINGDYSRRFPQKSLRLVAKSKFGPNSINQKVFTDFAQSSFKRLELTNSGNDWGGALLRDAIGSRLVSHILPTEHNRLSVVYLNGEYWGVHTIREHIDKFMLESLYGIDPDNIDYLSRQYEIEDGEDIYYKQFLDYVQATDLTSDENFKEVEKQMDINNYLNYFSSEIYYANTDWPQSNIEYWRARVPLDPRAPEGKDGKWRWILHDMDQGFVDAQFNSIEWVTAAVNPDRNEVWPNVLLRKLLTNEKFKFGFINRIADQLNSSYVTTRANAIVDSMKAVLQPEVAEHALRWRLPSSASSWSGKVDAIKTFNTQRPAALRGHVISHFGLGSQLNVTLNVSDKSHGSIKLNSLIVNSGLVGANAAQPYPWTGIYFANVPLTFKALASPGYVFHHWIVNGQEYTTEELTITPTAAVTATAYFEATTGVVPVLTSPVNAVKNVPSAPAVFTWQAVPQATAYRIQVSLKNDFLAPASDQSGIAVTTANVTGLLDSALYYWRVRAVGPNGSSEWSEVRTFTTVPTSTPYPALVTLVSPVKNATNIAITPTLTWNASSNADFYTVQVSDASDFDDLIVNQFNILTTSLKVKGLKRNGTFFWRVRATNERGTTAWSEVRSFRTTSLSAASSLAGYWNLNEQSGKLLLDASGNGNNAVLQTFDDVIWVPAVEDHGLSVLGMSNMFGIAPNSASLNITSKITIAAWIRPAEVATRTVISKTGPDGYELGVNANGKVEFRFNSTTNGSTYRLLSTGNYIADGVTWTHIAATFDGTSSKIYINGVLSGSATYGSTVTIRTNTSGLYIGALAGSQRWKGLLDDIQLYNRDLTAAEITELVSPVPGAPIGSPSVLDAGAETLINAQNDKLKFYPNPVLNRMNLEFKTGVSGKVAITITDVLGKVCVQSNHNLATNRLALDLTGQLKPGVYFLTVRTLQSSQVIKFVKQ